MARPDIRFWSGKLFQRQLNAVLDWLESSGGGGGGGALIGNNLTVSPTSPSSPADNDIWIESSASAPSAGQFVSIGMTPPGSPAVGDLWIDTN